MADNRTLSREDADLFYRLFFPLLDFANRQYHIVNTGELYTHGKGINTAIARTIAQYIWKYPSCIDAYLKQAKISKEKRNIIRSWKNRINGQFAVERHLETGSIFISENDKVYLVKGLYDAFDNLFPLVPTFLEGTLLPFGDIIISDGLFMVSSAPFDEELKEIAEKIYINAEKNGMIHTTL